MRPSLTIYNELSIPTLLGHEGAWVKRVTAMQTTFLVDGLHRQYAVYHIVPNQNPAISFAVAEIWDRTFRWLRGAGYLDLATLNAHPLELFRTDGAHVSGFTMLQFTPEPIISET